MVMTKIIGGDDNVENWIIITFKCGEGYCLAKHEKRKIL